MSAHRRLFTSLASGSGKATSAGVAVVFAVIVLAGCGGSGGSATEAGAPVVRGDAAATNSASASVAAPGFPAISSVVAGDGKVTVTVVPWTSGGTPASYSVKAQPSSFGSIGTAGKCTVTGASGSCDVTGLTNGISYEAYATATNTAGTSASSKASARFTPAAGPGAPATPAISTVVGGAGKISVSVVPGTGGGTPTSFTVTAYRTHFMVAGSCAVTGASGSCDVTGLAAGTGYTVRATATNAVGTSGVSGESGAVTVVAR